MIPAARRVAALIAVAAMPVAFAVPSATAAEPAADQPQPAADAAAQTQSVADGARLQGSVFEINQQLAAAVGFYYARNSSYSDLLKLAQFGEHPTRAVSNGFTQRLTQDDAGGPLYRLSYGAPVPDRLYTNYTYTLKPGRTLAVSVANDDADDLEDWRMFTLAVHQSGVPSEDADSLIIHDRSGGVLNRAQSFSGGFNWTAGHHAQTSEDWIKYGDPSLQWNQEPNRYCALMGEPQNVGSEGPVGTIGRGADRETVSVRNTTNADQTITVSVLPGALTRKSGGLGAWRVSFSEGVFSDVNASTPHVADIEWLAQSGITSGYKDGSFRGGAPVVRQDMAAFLYRLAGSPAFNVNGARNPFVDVNASTPHYKEILWLASTGISTGWRTPRGVEFRGMNAVVRQDMAAFLKRLADYREAKPVLGKAVSFRDVNAGTPHSAEIAWLAKTGVTTGWKDGTFRGMNAVVRQDMAAFLHRMKTNVIK